MRTFDDPQTTTKTETDCQQFLSQLQSFRANPTTIIQLLNQRLERYKSFSGRQFLFSQKYRKKAIEIQQQQKSQTRINQLINLLLSSTQSMPIFLTTPKLHELANKLCHIVHSQMTISMPYKPQTAKALRQVLNTDPMNEYPKAVTCLVSLGFNQPYQSLINLLIDDGVRNRSNRITLLNPNLKYVGLSSLLCQSDPELRYTVYVFTEQIINKTIKFETQSLKASHNGNRIANSSVLANESSVSIYNLQQNDDRLQNSSDLINKLKTDHHQLIHVSGQEYHQPTKFLNSYYPPPENNLQKSLRKSNNSSLSRTSKDILPNEYNETPMKKIKSTEINPSSSSSEKQNKIASLIDQPNVKMTTSFSSYDGLSLKSKNQSSNLQYEPVEQCEQFGDKSNSNGADTPYPSYPSFGKQKNNITVNFTYKQSTNQQTGNTNFFQNQYLKNNNQTNNQTQSVPNFQQ